MSRISGCTILRNGVKLRYPFEESVASYAPLCAEVVVCWDPTSEDETEALVRRVADRFPQVRLVESAWDLSNRHEGTELARQTQIAFGHCKGDWTLYVQADEALHEEHFELLRSFAQDPRLVGVAFQRLSFLEVLDREIPAHRAQGMLRMFRSGRGRSVGDAMFVQIEGRGGVVDSPATLFNYSRLGSPDEARARCVNLHRFYHDDGWLREHDSADDTRFETVPFTGSHPSPIESSFRRGTSGGTSKAPRVAVLMESDAGDRFAADLLRSSIEALDGYADEIILVDVGMNAAALEAVHELRVGLPITLIDATHLDRHPTSRDRLAREAVGPEFTHIHRISPGQVYLPSSLRSLKIQLHDPSLRRLTASGVRFVIEPSLVESTARTPVCEAVGASPADSLHDGSGTYLDFELCRPQHLTFLAWLARAKEEVGSLTPYQWEVVDGALLPWFRDGRNPDTILEPRRSRLRRYEGSYPPTVRPWLEAFSKSRAPWPAWVRERCGAALWSEWTRLFEQKGAWEATLDDALALPGRRGDRLPALEMPARASAPPASVPVPPEFRRGFSILMPTWNTLPYLKKAVESIRRHSAFDHEILVHVNEGTDGTLEWLREAGLKFTHSAENVGVCAAVNRAASLATRDLVYYFNDDMVALPEWDWRLAEYAGRHELDRTAWLSSTLIEPTGSNPDFIAPLDYGTSAASFDEDRLLRDLPALRGRRTDLQGVVWAPTLLYRETFDRIGGFSEEFFPGFGSEVDLAKKVWDLGSRCLIGVAKSLVYHFQCKGTGKLPRRLHNDAPGTFLKKYGLTMEQFKERLRAEARPPASRSIALEVSP